MCGLSTPVQRTKINRMMNKTAFLVAGLFCVSGILPLQVTAGDTPSRPPIVLIDPPEKEFFSKMLDYHGIPIKAHTVVTNEALYIAYDRLSMMLSNLPMVISNLAAAEVALHIIGRDQVTTDLPEWRHDKGRIIPEYNGLTRDQRTRGMGGRLTSCGEENLLKLDNDRYKGRDICVHEFAHAIRNRAMSQDVRAKFNSQYTNSLAKGLWKGSYAGSNPDEFFSELTMWYFGTHGDLKMEGPKPENGREGLAKYDPEALVLFDEFYSGRIPVSKVEPRRRNSSSSNSTTGQGTTNSTPRQ
jgi:hypothetical protein